LSDEPQDAGVHRDGRAKAPREMHVSAFKGNTHVKEVHKGVVFPVVQDKTSKGE
jgi:hypothetical protein